MSCAGAVTSRLPAVPAAGCLQRAARPRAPACSLGSPAAQRRQQSWAQPQLQQQQGRQRQQRRRGALAVHASSTYGSEWSTPKDAYLTVVRGAAGQAGGLQEWTDSTGGTHLVLLPSTVPPVSRAARRDLRSDLRPAADRPRTDWPLPLSLHAIHPPQGLAHCYVKGDDGRLADRYVIEPITANSLECMANGAREPVAGRGWRAGRPLLWRCGRAGCASGLCYARAMLR